MSGCPTSTADNWLKLTSVGSAANQGLAGNSSGNTRTVEAVYPYTPTPPTYGIQMSGASLYSSNAFDSTITNFTVNPGNPQPYIQILSGDITCNTPTVIYANIILGNGSVSTKSNCTISGDLYASGSVNVKGEVTGNVYTTGAAGPTISGLVDGSVYSANGATISGRVHGNVVAGPGTAPVNGGGIVDGTVKTAGTVSGLTIHGAAPLQNQTGIVTPVIPSVPPWADYTYSTYAVDGVKWTNPDGTVFANKTLVATDCGNIATIVGALTTPTIVDTRACGNLTTVPSLTLQTDVAVIANGLSIVSPPSVVIKSSSATLRKLWLIVPDADATTPVTGIHVPNCPAGSGGVTIGNNTVVNSLAQGNPVAAMLYSPCPLSNQGFSWNGQLYVASINSNSSATLTSDVLGIPGQNLSTGDPAPGGFPGTGVLGARASMRDIVGG